MTFHMIYSNDMNIPKFTKCNSKTNSYPKCRFKSRSLSYSNCVHIEYFVSF